MSPGKGADVTPIDPDVALEAGPGSPPHARAKPHVMVIGHSVGVEFYGAERSLLSLLAAIDRSRYEVSCVLPGASEAYLRSVAAHADRVTVLPYHWSSSTLTGDGSMVARFAELFRDARADLVHVNTITLLDPLIAARRVGVPSILHAREIISGDHEL